MKKNFRIIILLMLCSIITTAQWSLTGNAGTNPASNFLGTTDAHQLVFRVNNFRGGYIDYSDAPGNAGLGYGVLQANTTGSINAAFGHKALYNNTTGLGNTAVGFKSLTTNKTGSYNTALGSQSLKVNTASNNTAAGYAVLYSNTMGYNNTGMGYKSLFKNTIGYWNTAIGDSSLLANTTGYRNTATGCKSLLANDGGYQNTATGYDALFSNTVGRNNSASGVAALYSNTTGEANCAEGYVALYNNKTGIDNSAFGSSALYYNTGTDNSSFGALSLLYNSTGSNNTGVGHSVMEFNQTGNNNTAVGSNADVNGGAYSNITLVGYQAAGTASDQVRIGNSSVTSIGGFANWSNISDGRVKKNIKENIPGLAFINKLKPVSYNLNIDAADKIIQRSAAETSEGKTIQPSKEEIAGRKAKEQILYSGFIAQDVEKAAKEIGYDFSGVDPAKNDKDLYGLRYAEFVVPLVKAVQELDENQKAEIKSQNEEIEALKKQIDELKTMIISNQPTVNSQQSIAVSGASLSQNIPNPFTNSTTINYTIPQKYLSAQIIITDKSGKQLQHINLTGNGNGSVRLDASSLSAGAYQYSLYVDSKLVCTKQMIIVK